MMARMRRLFSSSEASLSSTLLICAICDSDRLVMPGDNVSFVVDLIAPIAMEERLRFAIREGGRTVGAGVVSKILE